jgi:hypothetical protein
MLVVGGQAGAGAGVNVVPGSRRHAALDAGSARATARG